ncbi:MAG: extracellular solute-binding protein [Chloroflexi bacterium]|nr:extracellular solute-binding protein [Chloroflexota bacterium]
MTQTKTRWLTLSLFVLALVMLAVPFVSAQDLSGDLDVMGFGLGDEIATVRADYAQAQLPGVTVNFAEGGFDPQQFLTAVASGNPPDVVYMDRQRLGTYAANGTLMPLEECVASQSIDMSQYRDVAVNQVTIDGQLYGIPEFFNNLMLIINTKALDDAGLTLDDVDTSDWEALRGLDQALVVGTGNDLTRIGFDPKLPEFLPLWVAANGGQMISDDGRTAMLNDPAVVEALEYAVSLLESSGGWAPFKAFRDTWDFFGGANQVAADQIAFWPMEQWYMNVLAGVSPDAPVAFKAFTDKEGNPISYSTGSAWAIPVGSGNPEAACAFAKAMTSTEAWSAAATERARLRAESGAINTGVYTANRLADEAIFEGGIVAPIENEAFQNGVDVILSLQENAFAMPANPAGAEFQQAWQDAVNRVLNGEQSVQEALDQAQTEAQAALDAAWSRQTS